MDAMEEFEIFETVDRLPDNAYLLTTRCGNVPRGPDQMGGCAGLWPEGSTGKFLGWRVCSRQELRVARAVS
eukprot:6861084-Pyramimonas_sp.AAC.1